MTRQKNLTPADVAAVFAGLGADLEQDPAAPARPAGLNDIKVKPESIAKVRTLGEGQSVVLENLPEGGSFEARRQRYGKTMFYWRHRVNGQSLREPVGALEPAAVSSYVKALARAKSLASATPQTGARSPAFIVRVVSDYNGVGQRLQWETTVALEPWKLGRPRSLMPEQIFYGRYACYPITVEPPPIDIDPQTMMATVPIEVLAEIQMALATGVVPRGLKTRLADVVARATAHF